MMTENEIIDLFVRKSALLDGHFILSSGLHSNRYIQCALVLQHPDLAQKLGAELGAKLNDLGANAVAGPALGGVLVAHEVARALGVRALFSERENGVMILRRGFRLDPGEPVLVVEDVITTGKSTRETMDAVERAGGKVIGVGALVDRSGGEADFPVPTASLLGLTVRTWDPADCPLCKAGTPAIKPGSRKTP